MNSKTKKYSSFFYFNSKNLYNSIDTSFANLGKNSFTNELILSAPNELYMEQYQLGNDWYQHSIRGKSHPWIHFEYRRKSHPWIYIGFGRKS